MEFINTRWNVQYVYIAINVFLMSKMILIIFQHFYFELKLNNIKGSVVILMNFWCP